MKPRFPLYAQILAWFFLNLLVIGAALLFLFRGQFQFGFDALLANRARDRLQPLTQMIAQELATRPRPDWDSVLQRFGDAWHMDFLLYRMDGFQVAGKEIELPAEVRARLLERRLMRAGEPRPGEFIGEQPERFPRREFDGQPRDARLPPQRPLSEPPANLAPPAPVNAGPLIVRTHASPRYWIGLRVPLREAPEFPGPGGMILFVASDSLRAGGLLIDYTLWIWVGAGALVFSILFWLPLVRSITRSISQMKNATAQIAEGRFDVRVNESRRDELGSLGSSINQMAGRLDGFVTGQKRFLGDIAHELCSPIARMQMAVGILEERGDAKDAKYIADLREEIQEMSALVNELLAFSKASLGANSVRLQPVAIRAAVERAVKREADKHPNLQIEIDEDLKAMADPELLVRAVSNLLRNAIRYASQSPISISASANNGQAELIVADSGPGVPESEIPKLFDPFYRVDSSRARETGGAGLGLSIVKTCIETCRGTVTCHNRQPSGLEVVIRLPITP